MASVSVMLLMVSASAATSPFDFTVRFCLRSPLATAVTTFMMPRTCSVRFAAITRRAGHLAGEGVQLVDHRVDGVLQLEDFALHVDGDLAAQVAARHRRGDFGDVTDLRREVRREQVDVVGE